jgi:hypothetical protein
MLGPQGKFFLPYAFSNNNVVDLDSNVFWEWECGMRLCYELTIANIEIYEVMKTLALVYVISKNINQLKVKLKSIYQNLVETTFDTNNYCRPTLVSWLVRVRDVILFFYFSQSLSPHLLCRPAQHTLIIIINSLVSPKNNHLHWQIEGPTNFVYKGSEICWPKWFAMDKYIGNGVQG